MFRSTPSYSLSFNAFLVLLFSSVTCQGTQRLQYCSCFVGSFLRPQRNIITSQGSKEQTTLFIQLPTVFEIIIKVSIPDIFTKCNTTVCFSTLRNAYLIYACALIYYHQNLQWLELIQLYVSIQEAQRRYLMLRVEESETLLSSKLFVLLICSYILSGTRLQTH